MTYRWEPTTPLDRILETGFKRIDEAVEGVIDKYAPTLVIRTKIIKECVICGKENPHKHQSFCIDLNCSGQLMRVKARYSDHQLLDWSLDNPKLGTIYGHSAKR